VVYRGVVGESFEAGEPVAGGRRKRWGTRMCLSIIPGTPVEPTGSKTGERCVPS
jgi:hypothetical protein